MFERFTDRARRVVVLAQEEARLLNHNYIGTEHILLGLLQDADCVAARALEECGVSRPAARDQVINIVGAGPAAPSGHIPFTPRSKKVLELSLREAMQLGHNYIGTEHILLGLIREGEGVGAQVLVALGADLSGVRQTVLQILATGPSEPAAGRTGSASFVGGRAPGCAFCGRDESELGYVVAGSGALICEQCIADAAGVVEEARAEKRDRAALLHLPPRVSGSIRDDVAVAAIQHAFAEVFGSREPSEGFDDVLEDAANLAEAQEQLRSRAPQGLGSATHVVQVSFDAPDRARVRFVIVPRGLGVFAFEGLAVRRGDRWMVSRDTWCEVAARGGVQCPPPRNE